MKNKIIYLGSIGILLILSLAFHVYDRTEQQHRVHQHLEAENLSNLEEKKEVKQDENFYTHLPIIKIETNGQTVPGEAIVDEKGVVVGYTTTAAGEKMIEAEVATIDHQKKENCFNDQETMHSKAKIRYRGNSSRRFDKKSYAIRLIHEDGTEKKSKMLGMSKHDDWVLYGPYLDKTLMRNYMWMNISGEIMGYAPNVRFCEVFVDGVYQGVYVLMESIAQGKDRVNLTKYKPGDKAIAYIIRVDKDDGSIKMIDDFLDYTYVMEYKTSVGIVYPGRKHITKEVKEYIENDLAKFEKSLFSYDFNSGKRGYEKYIDVSSFVDYYILQEFLSNNDMCSRSTYLYKDIRGKLHMGPVWDYNNVMDNYFRSVNSDGSGIQYADRLWYKMLFKDKRFVDQVVTRYRQLRKTYLNEEYLYNYIDETEAYLGDAIARNYSVWGYTFEPQNLPKSQKLSPDERNPRDYDDAIDEMKEFIHARGKWLDNHIDTLYQYCQDSKNKNELLK